MEESYRPKMVLSEFLAVAVLRNIRYARVLASYVSQDIATFAESNFDTMRRRMLGNEAGPQPSTNLLFAVARAYSKLAEIDPSRVDLSTVGALLNHLDDPGAGGQR